MTNKIELPNLEDAAGMLDRLYADVFFSKMAEYGFSPTTEEGAYAMLETAASLDAIPSTKEAQAAHDPFVAANSSLKQALSQAGLTNDVADNNEKMAAAITQAAVAFAHEPELYKAVLAIKSANTH